MTGWLYEQDLVTQKYRILIAVRHDHLVRQIAGELGIPVQALRKYLIGHLDMILLENLPARAEMAKKHADMDDPIGHELGREKYTNYLQIVSRPAMDAIFVEVKARVNAGTPAKEAIAYGRARIREELHL